MDGGASTIIALRTEGLVQVMAVLSMSLFPPFMFQHKALKLSHLVLTINFPSSFMITAALSQSGRHGY